MTSPTAIDETDNLLRDIGAELVFGLVAPVGADLERLESETRLFALEDRKGHVPIIGCDVESVLEAAHVDRHIEHGDNSLANGILLRSK